MNTNDPRREDGGYGASSLVGSNTSGLQSALEAREAVDAARDRGTQAPDDAKRANADLGRLADAPLSSGPRAGVPTLQDTITGSSAPSAPRDARDDANRLEP